MKKTKIKQRFANAADAFFADEDSGENNYLRFTSDSEVLRNESSHYYVKKTGSFLEALKQILLFFPGTYLLFGSTTVLFWNYFVYQPANLTCFSVAVGGGLMTVLGIGEIKKITHLVIPISVVLISTLLFLITLGLGKGQNFMQDVSYWLFPLVFTMPFLAKGLIDRKNES